MTTHLQVWRTTPLGTSMMAGELIVTDPQPNGALAGQFRYHQSYLAHPDAIALDPLHLPLQTNVFDANRPGSGTHAVFEDSLPDDWGRRMLVRRHQLSRSEQRVPNLLAVIGNGLGALSFLPDGQEVVTTPLPTAQLEHLLTLAHSFENNEHADQEKYLPLFTAGSSPGGARPKVITSHEGIEWIAKFPSVRDNFDIIGLEFVTMQLAKQAGIKSALTRVIPCGKFKILLSKRFDITNSGGRNHMVSMQTLTGAEGYYSLGYRDMAETIRKISSRPNDDLLQLFKQMVFNVMVGNTDDHLKNFSMLHTDHGWQLSPAYDILPNIGQNMEHQLHINGSFLPPDMQGLLSEAKQFSIKREKQAREIIYSIGETVLGIEKMLEKNDIPREDRTFFAKDISRRVNKIMAP